MRTVIVACLMTVCAMSASVAENRGGTAPARATLRIDSIGVPVAVVESPRARGVLVVSSDSVREGENARGARLTLGPPPVIEEMVRLQQVPDFTPTGWVAF